ncbi:MAG: hypothetical protein A2X18_05085 [Bacteroidetes bacterium GWF2_40_14]|nr:MAG: hypothetical protein A2X18_05085 [Bacteroidetes bacterium GWF2_40_14]
MQANITTKVFVVFFLLSTCSISLSAQQDSTKSVTFSGSADIFSQYIWRGQDYGHVPSLQPGVSASWKNFTIGAWGAFRIAGPGDDELDFYISKEIGPVSLSVWDYWSYSKTNPSAYFNYSRESTSHLLEGQILLSGGDKLPFNLLGSYFFYGSDPSKSIYLELQFVQPIKRAELMIFTGFQPKGSFYAEKAGFVNLGATFRQPMLFSDNCNFDLLLSLIANPQTKTIFFTIGVSLYK